MNNSTNNNRSRLFLFALLAFFTTVVGYTPVHAQDKYTLLEPLPCIPSPKTVDGNGNVVPEVKCPKEQVTEIDFQGYVQYMFNLLIALAAVASVFMIVWGGFQYMTTDSVGGKSEGINKLKNAVSGLVLVLCSYLILRTIDPRLVAIPVNLVEPIEIKCASDKELAINDPGCKSSSLGQFFNQLISEAEKHQTRINSLGNVIVKSKEELSKLTLEKQKLEDDLEFLYQAGYEDSDTEVKLIRSKLANNANEAVRVGSLVPISSVALDITGALKQTVIELEEEIKSFTWLTKKTTEVERLTAILEANESRINKIRDSGNKALLERGLDTSTPGGINDTANYAEIMLAIMKSDIMIERTVVYSKEKAFSYKDNKVLPLDDVRSQLSQNIEILESRINGSVQDPTLRTELGVKLQNSRKLLSETLPE